MLAGVGGVDSVASLSVTPTPALLLTLSVILSMFLGFLCLGFPICKPWVTGGAHGVVVNSHEVLKGHTVNT